MKYSYYYNQKAGETPWRNNLVYTSLMREDSRMFVKWYHNDSEYHMGMNEVVKPELMEEKWQREVKYLTTMARHYPQYVPFIDTVDHINKKIYLEVDGVDLWQRSLDKNECGFEEIVPDWQEQMLEIIKAHKSLGLYKYSMHPSSYFVVDGKLKSINYFFTYHESEDIISIESFLSHVSHNRRILLKEKSDAMGIKWDEKTSFKDIQMLCFEAFSDNYPREFIDKAKEIYV